MAQTVTDSIDPEVIDANFPEKLECFWLPMRYKVAYGGRGSAKSWTIAGMLVIKASQEKLRVLCVRELQKSIEESVHKLLSDQIERFKLSGMFVIEQKSIYCPLTLAEFIFEGIRNNATKIKSYEGIDIAWAEEAQAISHDSWKVLIPTIRKPGSEIWISFNPELATDSTYKRFVLNPPKQSFVVEINWKDNPHFPDILRDEMEELRVSNFDEYLNVWEGKCKIVLEGSVYKEEIRAAMLAGQITKVPYTRGLPVNTYWDLGRGDMTTIWFIQRVGLEWRIIDYHEAQGKLLDYYFEVLQNRHYVYGTHFLPHDAKHERILHPLSIVAQFRAKGFKCKVVKKLRISDGINAVRTIFNQVVFDEAKTAVGFNHLQHYSWKIITGTTSYSKEPNHNQHSHAADALRTFASSTKETNIVKDEDGEIPPSDMIGRAKRMGKKLLKIADLLPTSDDWMG